MAPQSFRSCRQAAGRSSRGRTVGVLIAPPSPGAPHRRQALGPHGCYPRTEARVTSPHRPCGRIRHETTAGSHAQQVLAGFLNLLVPPSYSDASGRCRNTSATSKGDFMVNRRNVRLTRVVLLVLVLALGCATAALAEVYSCEQSPYLCYRCWGHFPFRSYCMMLPYGVQGACGCQDTEGCGTFGNTCVAIIAP